jgi:hypothetical protein
MTFIGTIVSVASAMKAFMADPTANMAVASG